MIIEPEFKGRLPYFSKESLPPGYAQTAENCRFDRGRLEGIAKGVYLLAGTNVKNKILGFHKWRGTNLDGSIVPIQSISSHQATIDNTAVSASRPYNFYNFVSGANVLHSLPIAGTLTSASISSVSGQTGNSPILTLSTSGGSSGGEYGDLILLDRATPLGSSTMSVIKETPLRVQSYGGIPNEIITGDIVSFSGTGEAALDGINLTITVVDDYNFTLNSTVSGDIAASVTTGSIIYRNAAGRFMRSTRQASFSEGGLKSLDTGWLYFAGTLDSSNNQYPCYTIWPNGGKLGTTWPTDTNLPETFWPLGVPAPTSALTVAAGAGGSGDAIIDRSYVFTNVFIHNGIEMESAPSAADTVTGLMVGQAVSITIPSQTHTGYYTTGGKLRIYRSAIGNETVEYRFVKEVDYGDLSASDDVAEVDLGEVIPTYQTSPAVVTWDTPPDRLRNLVLMPNGIMAGSVDNTVYFSVAYQHHAWPEAYSLTVDSKVIALAVADTDLFILTDKGVHIATGTDPAFMTARALPGSYGCVSARSVSVTDEGGVIYSSAKGLIVASRSGVTNISERILTKEQWDTFMPFNIAGAYYEGKYFAGYTGPMPLFTFASGTGGGIFVFDVRRNEWIDVDNASDFTVGEVPVSVQYNKQDSTIYYGSIWGSICAFGASKSGTLTYTWRSRVLDVSGYGPLSVCQIKHDPDVSTSNVTLKIYSYSSGTSTLRHTESVSGLSDPNAPFSVTASSAWRYLEIEVTGTSPIRSILLAPSHSELGKQGIAIGAL